MLKHSFKTDSKALILSKNGISTTSKHQKNTHSLIEEMINNDGIQRTYLFNIECLIVKALLKNSQHLSSITMSCTHSLEAI